MLHSSSRSLVSAAFKAVARHQSRVLSARRVHNFALTRQIPSSVVNSLSKYFDGDNTISIPVARSQHDDYVSVLRSVVPTLLLPPVEEHPDSVFVEDTVVAVCNKAVITFPGHESRQGEVVAIRSTLMQLGMEVMDMHSKDLEAVCDGGDVLYTGRHMFVGLSDRTNEEGAQVLAEAFSSQCPVIPVQLNPEDALHLKSIVTHLDDKTLLAPIGTVGDAVLEKMDAEANGYSVVRLPDIRACNVVAINNTIIASSSSSSESQKLLRAATEERNLQLRLVETTEIEKSDGACTCCSVLLEL